ncbi:MAG: ferredoxin [Candidatus Aenigmarchaeota archaeon]|nr:ferredoxin [Candidatus Aenigmarchaeota archaeon]
MPKKFKIVFDKEACIGAFFCISTDPKNWVNAPYDNRKVDLRNGIFNPETKKFEKVVNEDEFMEEAEKTCPVFAIKIVEISEADAEKWKEWAQSEEIVKANRDLHLTAAKKSAEQQ